MIHSMTGYGKSSRETEQWQVSVEIRSVNHRFCEITLNMPQNLAAIDYKLRHRVKNALGRGKADVVIRVRSTGPATVVRTDTVLADAYVHEFELLCNRYGREADWHLSDLLNREDILYVDRDAGDTDALYETVISCCDDALRALNDVRATEGQYLRDDLRKKIAETRSRLHALAERVPTFQTEYLEKLRSRVDELAEGHLIGEERLAMEVAMLADKVCIDEEIVRSESHCAQLDDLFETESGQVGRHADFILQELQREANTILSKATDADITTYGIAIKSLIEQMREQVQNLL